METKTPNYREIPKTIRAVVPKIATHDLLDRAPSLLQTVSEPQSQSAMLSRTLLDKLWIKMAEFYGHRWTSSFGVIADPEHTWAKVLAGVTGIQIANGLHALIERGDEFDWPPPANVFLSLCLQVKGLPTEAQAWDEARSGKYTHEAVRIAAEATSTFDLHGSDSNDKALRQRFERNYAIVMRRAQTGQNLEGRIAHGVGHDSMRDPRQVQLEHSRKEAEALVAAQGIPNNAQAARYQLLTMLGIRRNDHV
ncbi:hypothetical protein [Pseudomonas savastanoi]|nr:hypothetical protein [Pseudomonas savastanoi]ARD11390.1 hypothetical protein PSA3335_10120 [Pseudomonas savastanoi pv. savastanoi NCPPB 3335]MBA4702944.1 hypothetical protein [Pseudomonas savastanoi pv. savastanoi]RMT72365.1 hypothetical protein ALP42_02563 [Pseudomonas savastanoi pv. nerii]RMT86382.1 hypothetical protein ALP41_00458 [Pseudomonas savastanoi pv. nerii]